MKKLALAMMAASAAVFGLGVVAQAQTGYDESVVANPTTLSPDESYDVTYFNCVAGDTITFAQADSDPTEQTAPCLGLILAEPEVEVSSIVGLLLPQAPPVLGNATVTFAAPGEAGDYDGTAVGLESPELPWSITVEDGEEPTPTTEDPVEEPVEETEETTTTEAGGATLPDTGSDGMGAMTAVALGLLVMGFGLFVVAQLRRKQTFTA